MVHNTQELNVTLAGLNIYFFGNKICENIYDTLASDTLKEVVGAMTKYKSIFKCFIFKKYTVMCSEKNGMF